MVAKQVLSRSNFNDFTREVKQMKWQTFQLKELGLRLQWTFAAASNLPTITGYRGRCCDCLSETANFQEDIVKDALHFESSDLHVNTSSSSRSVSDKPTPSNFDGCTKVWPQTSSSWKKSFYQVQVMGQDGLTYNADRYQFYFISFRFSWSL